MDKYRSAYCTLNSIVEQRNADSSNKNVATTSGQTAQINTEDANYRAYTKRLIREASGAIARKHNRVFMPYDQTYTLRSDYMRKNLWRDAYEYRLLMPDDLLAITLITWIGTALSASAYRMASEQMFPNWEIAIDPDALGSIYPADFSESVSIAGTWGYHRDPDNMWVASGDTVQNTTQISASGTTLQVIDGTSFEIMQYIKIESEYLLITAIITNNLTVERGVNGSTAAVHANGTGISTYRQTPEIDQETRRIAIRHFNLRGGVGDPKNFAYSSESVIEIDPYDVREIVDKRALFRTV